MTGSTSHSNSLWAYLIIEELIRNGVDCFCLSPGSRSTPLASAVAQNEKANALVHFDERGAAFYALGYGRATGRAAALICTSGTAVANYMPAVVEASMDMIPMILLTADRPPELRQTGANQVIDQVKIFGDYARWQFDLPCPDDRIAPEFVLTTVDQAVYRAQGGPPGPVHLNCMFREPFLPEQSQVVSVGGYPPPLDSWYRSRQPFTSHAAATCSISDAQLGDVATSLNNAGVGLLIVGRLRNESERRGVLRLSEKLGWLTLPDVSSGLRLNCQGANMVPYYDLLLVAGDISWIKEPVILHVGDRFVSKRLLTFLANTPLQQYIMVADHPFRHDPSHRVTTRVESDIAGFCDALIPRLSTDADPRFIRRFAAASAVVADWLEIAIDGNTRLNEPSCARLVSQYISSEAGLFLASSMPVRDMDTFGDVQETAAPAPVACNRGASGIDGAIASAAGFAAGLEKPVTLLTGDLAFLHDINSLAMLKSLSHPLVVVVINNNGGGIFSFLSVAREKGVFERFFAAPHDITFEKAAALFGLDYHAPDSKDSFVEHYQAAQKGTRSTIIEVTSDRKENYIVHQTIQQKISEALADL